MKLITWLEVLAVVAVALCVTLYAVPYFQKPKDCPVCHNKGVIYERCPRCQGWGEIRKVCQSCGGKGWIVTVTAIYKRGQLSGSSSEVLDLYDQYNAMRMSGSLTQEQAMQRGEYEVNTKTCSGCEGKGWVMETCSLCRWKGYLIHPCPKCSKDGEVKMIGNPEPPKTQIHQTFNIYMGSKDK